ncbi:acetyl-coenzym A synthetase, mitochondrial [Pelomyxa schiedti]|nr:acetyl-coenzym A synthetase, mitochondrial [Pelomyxa schiedti]
MLSNKREWMRAFFAPKSVACVGATDKSGAGRETTMNLLDSQSRFKGNIYLVNPNRKTLLGVTCYPSIDKCPEIPEMVVIVVPAKFVLEVVKQCVDLGVQAIVVISAGFKEIGAAGKALEDQISLELKRSNGRTHLVGPNCIGVLDMDTGLNATFCTQTPKKGKIALISQSGGIVLSMIDMTYRYHIGLKACVSVGSMMDVNWGDLLWYFGADPEVNSIFMYMETMGNSPEEATDFLAAAREVSRVKPIVLIKPGKTPEVGKVVTSHTGGLMGSNAGVDAACNLSSILRVDTLEEFFDLATVTVAPTLPTGPNCVMITISGGAGVMVSDVCYENGAVMYKIPEKVIEELSPGMPTFWSHTNPMDLTGSATPENFQRCFEAMANLPDVDGVIVSLVALPYIPPSTLVGSLKLLCQRTRKPVMVALFGYLDMENSRRILIEGGVPTYAYPDSSARAYMGFMKAHQNRALLEAVPRKSPFEIPFFINAKRQADQMLTQVVQSGRTILTEAESKLLMKSYGIPVCETLPARTEDEAVKIGVAMGFPLVLKLLSETITHKSDVGGVMLNIKNEAEIRTAFNEIKANLRKHHPDSFEKHFMGVTVQPMLNISEGYELLLGCNCDPLLGPILAFGLGGKLVEVFNDTAIALPPLNSITAASLIRKTKVSKALKGVRGQGPVDMEKLENILIAFSYMITSHPEIKEVDINPLFASERTMSAIDARIVLWEPNKGVSKPVITPYPCELYNEVSIASKPHLWRPIRIDDEQEVSAWLSHAPAPAVTAFVGPQSSGLPVTHNLLVAAHTIDYHFMVTELLFGPDRNLAGFVRVTRAGSSATATASICVPAVAQEPAAQCVAAIAASMKVTVTATETTLL